LLHVCNSYYEATLFCCLLFSSIFCFFEGRWICTIPKFRETHVKNRRYFVRFWRWNSYFEYPLFKNRSVV
jgi:hypothetical protein